MGSRRRAREYALQALYQVDLSGITTRLALSHVWAEQVDGGYAGRTADSEEVEFALRLAGGVEERHADIDEMIDRASANWRLVRMPVVDRNILRLACFELLACQDIPASVSINEAVELAKKYGDKDSRAFVNGILDRIAFETGRGGRRHKR